MNNKFLIFILLLFYITIINCKIKFCGEKFDNFTNKVCTFDKESKPCMKKLNQSHFFLFL